MDIRARKKMFLESLQSTELIHTAVSLAIDCIIENHINEEEIPLVITGYDDFARERVQLAVQQFLEATYPKTDKNFFVPELLQIHGNTSEEACINLIKKLRCTSSILYWADSPSWFAGLPDGLFHVVSIDQNTVTRGLNKKNAKPTIIKKEYDTDTLLPELFFNIAHMDQANATNVHDADDRLYNECHAGIIRPIPAPAGTSYDDKITIDSPDWQKVACVAIRRYQSVECNDGMSWDTTDGGWVDVVAYPFVKELVSMDNGGYRQCLVGLVTIDISDKDCPYLSTVWIHPFYRGKKLLSDLWPELQERYGTDFGIEQPNANMRAFLKKIKHADY